jgi:invasion protein IalB
MLNKVISGLAALVLITSGAAFAEDSAPKEKTGAATPAAEKTADKTAEQKLPEGVEQFKDWIKECEKLKDPEGKEVEICQISQTLTNTEINQPMLKVAAGYVPGKKDAVLIITLPLGVILPPGVQLTVGEGKAARVPVTTCLPQGCQAGAQLDKEFTERLKKGDKLIVTFIGPDGKQVNAPISLSGFTAGLDSIKPK